MQVQAEVKRRFRRFLTEYTAASGEKVHDRIIDEMTAANSPSLPISYLHLSTAQPTFGIWLADMPRLMLELFDEVAKQVVLERHKDYDTIVDSINVRITSLPIEDKVGGTAGRRPLPPATWVPSRTYPHHHPAPSHPPRRSATCAAST